MVGISYPGISQLFVAATQPPHLAAIAPLSVIADTGPRHAAAGRHLQRRVRAVVGRRDRQHDARGRARERSGLGRRSHRGRRHSVRREPDRARPGARRVADDRRQPVLERRSRRHSRPSCSSTRSRCPCSSPAPGRTSRPARTSPTCSTTSPAPTRRGSRSRTVRTPTRSIRPCSTGGSSSCRSTSRRSCRSGRRLPRVVAAVIGQEVWKTRGHAAARSLRRRDVARSRASDLRSRSAAAHPVRERRGRRTRPAVRALRRRLRGLAGTGHRRRAPWYFDEGSALVDGAPAHRRQPTSTPTTRRARTSTTLPGDRRRDSTWLPLPPWNWTPPPADNAVAYETAPLAQDTVMVGTGSVDLWIKADARPTSTSR